MDFDYLIAHLKRHPGFEAFTPDKEGIYRITINNNFIICLANAPDSSNYFLYSSICPVPAEDTLKLQLFEQLLSSHLFGKTYFALDTRQGTILLVHPFDTSLENIEIFMKELKDFVNMLSYWQERLTTERRLPG